MILRFIRSCLRRVLNLSFLAALSVLLFIGLGCVWERSMRVCEELTYARSSGYLLKLITYPRQFGVSVCVSWGVPRNIPPRWGYGSIRWPPEQMQRLLEMMWGQSRLGFAVHNGNYYRNDESWRITTVLIPLWFPMVLTLIAPLCWLRRWRRQARRVRLGLCLHCGYDLRATPAPTGPRVPLCPECGREPS